MGTDGKSYVYSGNFIQRCDDDQCLNWVGPRYTIANAKNTTGVGLMENPSLMKRGDWYYWHESTNGTVTWGLAPDVNGHLGTANGNLAVWRSRSVIGPYEGPRLVITSNTLFTCVNTGTVVLGPDNVTWWYLYNAIGASRWNMQRQLFLDKIVFGSDGWPVPMTPSARQRFPAGATSTGPRWRPELSDEFNSLLLEGITSGVLGRKWLFKRENASLWSLDTTPGWLHLKTNCIGADSDSAHMGAANMLLQRPTSAYHTVETRMRWVGPCAKSGHGGIISRELNSGSGCAAGLVCKDGQLSVTVWQDTFFQLWTKNISTREVYIRLDVELVRVRAWYSVDGKSWDWISPNSVFTNPEMSYWQQATVIAWGSAHLPGDVWANDLQFTTAHPGLFAGNSTSESAVEFDYFRYIDNEVSAPSFKNDDLVRI